MYGLSILVVFVALATVPFVMRVERGDRRAKFIRKLALWAAVAVWLISTVLIGGYVFVARVFDCERRQSDRGSSSWSAVPFGQTCTYEPTETLPAEITRPGWGPTAALAVTLAGPPLLIIGRRRRN